MVSSHSGNVQKALKCVLNNLRQELNSLDWNYMADRTKGELFVDLAITYHPKGNSPLVGLWKLDHLEASYGAGGYNLGKMHHHNTLSHYGGLQAEMSAAQSDQSHILFRSTYGLAYEAVRRMDNSREHFKDTDVFSMSQNFIEQIGSVIQLFKETAQTKSYGLRDEFRLGYSALPLLGDHLGDLVSSIHKLLFSIFPLTAILVQIEDFESSGPFIWLHSETWFEFIWRRLSSLLQCQMKLYRDHHNPQIRTNYGVMSALFALLMQLALFTPPFIRPQVKDSLTSLNFAPLANRFGMFFLHDLDMSKNPCLPEVAEEDDFNLLGALGLGPKRSRQTVLQDQLWRGDQNNEEAYPLGMNLTWKELQVALLETPGVIMRQWSWPGDLDEFLHPVQKSVEDLATKLFKLFTAQIWAVLHASHKVSDGSLRKTPHSLQDAIAFWSLDSLHAQLQSYLVIPCNCPVRGQGPGRRVPSFEERVSLYFVEAGQDLQNHWAPLARNPGYIEKYRAEKNKLEDQDLKEQLDLALGKMLSYCQCLPNSKLDNSGGIWEVKQGKVILLSNPHYYRLRTVGSVPGQKRRARGAPAHATDRQLFRTLLELEGYSPDIANQTLRMEGVVKKMRSKSRSRKAKNFRVPPKRGAASRGNLQENVDEEGEPEEEPEEENEGDVEQDDSEDEDPLADIELSEDSEDDDF